MAKNTHPAAVTLTRGQSSALRAIKRWHHGVVVQGFTATYNGVSSMYLMLLNSKAPDGHWPYFWAACRTVMCDDDVALLEAGRKIDSLDTLAKLERAFEKAFANA